MNPSATTPGRLRALCLAGLLLASGPCLAVDAAGWLRYGMDDGGTRYSPATQIAPDNVDRLRVAWTYRTGDLGAGFAARKHQTFEATPILAEGLLYLVTGFNKVIALEPETGREVWRRDPGLDAALNYSEVAARGVSFWRDARASADADCASRIFLGTLDGRLLALDAKRGTPCVGFGSNGAIDLKTPAARPRDRGQYLVTSPPAIFEDVVIVGSAIGDNRAVEVERGVVQAFDARSGAPRWHWDPLPTDAAQARAEGWDERAAERTGAANAWAPFAVDAKLGLVFVPTGSASPDFYGGERAGNDAHANSLVALDARSGRLAWAQQLVHHDLWDFDLPAQPLLAEVMRDGLRVPAVIQTTKMGLVFSFDRASGRPLVPIVERRVPASDVPGEQASATQPFPQAPPPLVPQAALTPDDAWGLLFFDRLACRKKLAALRSEGIYTPPSLGGTLLYPSYAGGSNWGGLAHDPQRRLVFANVNRVPAFVRLIPREQLGRARAEGAPGLAAQTGTRYAMSRDILLSPIGIPCTAPPWGTLAAIDIDAGRIVWQVPLGTTRDVAPPPFWFGFGMPNFGGPIATASGLVFIAAASDNYLRAFDAASGKVLWKGRLPAGGQATPMTFVSPRDGRQYVVIAAGGHGRLGTTRGDHVVAFALPR
jgi:quinoprotein glucose dehydrogenase